MTAVRPEAYEQDPICQSRKGGLLNTSPAGMQSRRILLVPETVGGATEPVTSGLAPISNLRAQRRCCWAVPELSSSSTLPSAAAAESVRPTNKIAGARILKSIITSSAAGPTSTVLWAMSFQMVLLQTLPQLERRPNSASFEAAARSRALMKSFRAIMTLADMYPLADHGRRPSRASGCDAGRASMHG